MNATTATAFHDELAKIAQDEAETDAALAAGGLLGGGYVASKAKPLVTGRTRLLHGTAEEYVPKILDKGILPASAGGSKGVSEILDKAVRDPSKNLAFATRDPMQARGYAVQAAGMKKALTAVPDKHDIELAKAMGLEPKQLLARKAQAEVAMDPKNVGKILNPFNKKGVIEMDVPLWRKDVASKIRVNPEVASAKAAVDKGIAPNFAKALQKRQIQKELGDKVVALEGGISPEFMRGSSKFKGLSAREIVDYAKARPGRFAAGAGLGLLGAAGLGYGAYKGIGLLRGKKDDASVDPQQG
jgi:hypothetical protein